VLKRYFQKHVVEAGCDEAGRGCLAGPVFRAAVILQPDFSHPLLNDSKLLNEEERNELRLVIEEEAVSWAVARSDVKFIDQVNILQASIWAMHRALDQLDPRPEHIIIDGNYFRPYDWIPHQTIVKGDGKYTSIAAASVLAKTHRDEYMERMHRYYPAYHWNTNKGYPTLHHRKTVMSKGRTKHHRKSFSIKVAKEIR